jgi:hypothetical protein
MEGPPGLETALLLVRRTPLPEDVDLAALVGRVMPAKLNNPEEVAWLELTPGERVARQRKVLNRGLNTKQSKEIDEPTLRVLERLRPHFELLKAVRFAHDR